MTNRIYFLCWKNPSSLSVICLLLVMSSSGTGIRDYIHVVDLAQGHVAAFDRLKRESKIGCEVYNLGTGKGYSVLEMVAAFEKASGRKVSVRTFLTFEDAQNLMY